MATIHTFKEARFVCPACGHKCFDAGTLSDNPRALKGPQAGDVAVCAGCASLLTIVDEHTAKAITEAELPKTVPEWMRAELRGAQAWVRERKKRIN
jgi:hypothetical protein